MALTEEATRQVTIALAVAVKEPPELMVVQGISGGVQVSQVTLERFLAQKCLPLQENVDKEVFDVSCPSHDLLVTAFSRSASWSHFEMIQRVLPGQPTAIARRPDN